MNKVTKDLLSKILVADPEMWMQIPQIKEHPFFESVNWELAAQKELDVPFRPDPEGAFTDTFPKATPASNSQIFN